MPRKPRTAPRRLAKQDRARFTVDALLEGTARVLVREGYDRASTNRIAEAAGVNIGSLYQYFPSKEALVAALIDRHLAEIVRMLAQGMADWEAAPLPVAVREMVRAYLGLHRVDPRLHRALLEQVPRVERLNPVLALTRRVVDGVRQGLERHRGALRVRDLDLAAFAVVHIADALTQAAILERPELLESEAFRELISDILLRILLP